MAEKFVVDADAVRSLAQLLTETDLNEVEYQVGTHRIKVQRSPDFGGGVPQTAPVAQPTPAAAPQPTPVATPAADPAPASGETVKSPMVGTVYLQPEPDSDPFVSPGAIVKEGDTLLIVEAMKVMNPIRAPRAGKVVDILVADGSPVEFGEPLIVLE